MTRARFASSVLLALSASLPAAAQTPRPLENPQDNRPESRQNLRFSQITEH